MRHLEESPESNLTWSFYRGRIAFRVYIHTRVWTRATLLRQPFLESGLCMLLVYFQTDFIVLSTCRHISSVDCHKSEGKESLWFITGRWGEVEEGEGDHNHSISLRPFRLILSGVSLVKHKAPGCQVARNSFEHFLDRVDAVDNYFNNSIFLNTEVVCTSLFCDSVSSRTSETLSTSSRQSYVSFRLWITESVITAWSDGWGVEYYAW